MDEESELQREKMTFLLLVTGWVAGPTQLPVLKSSIHSIHQILPL